MASLKKLFAPVDMTAGKPWKNIALFTIPMIIGNIAQQLYNTVDSIVVGKFVGDNALAAVGSASPIFNLLLVLFIGISVGTSVMVSQYFGARDREQLSRTIGCCVTLTAAASVFIMIVGSLVVRPLLELLHTPASIIDWCASYLTVLFYGIAGVAYYNILGGVLRGLGIPFPHWYTCWWLRSSTSSWMCGSLRAWDWELSALPWPRPLPRRYRLFCAFGSWQG